MRLRDAITIGDLRRLAQARLPKIVFDFIDGGVEDEICLRANRRVLEDYRLIPRYLVDVSKRDQSISLFGQTYTSPFGIAPTGLTGLFRRGGDLMLAVAAASANVPYIMSSGATASLEHAASVARDVMWYQVYATNTRAIGHDLARRAADAGIRTLVVTVDLPLSQKRERNLRNGFRQPLRLTPAMIWDGLRHPGWLYDYLAAGGVPMMETWTGYAKPGASATEVAAFYASQNPSPSQTWHDLEEFRRLWSGNLVVKGILHPDDALRCVEMGVDGIYLSNHGGRQFDRAPSPFEMLPAVRAAVGEKVVLLVDSGVRRGIDVVLARCLGASAAFTGRATLFAVAAAGLPGARRALRILRQEVDMSLGALGCTAFNQLSSDHVFGETQQ